MFYAFLMSDPDNLIGSGSDQKVQVLPDPDPQKCTQVPVYCTTFQENRQQEYAHSTLKRYR